MNECKTIKICCITYNLKQKSLSDDEIKTFLSPHKQNNFDIYTIATQECERYTIFNIFYDDKSSFEQKLQNFFGEEFYNLNSITLAGIHLIIFAKKKYESFIKDCTNNYIKTGFYGLFGNKGAVSIYFKIYDTSFLFVNCHLIKGKENVYDRNVDSSYIYKSIHPRIDKVNNIIWLGCLNYKVDANLDVFTEAYIKGKEMNLLEDDQMIKGRKNNNDEFIYKDFIEGEIKFLPSSKYDIQTNKIDWTDKDNYPSWTDRIFYKINKNAIDNYSLDLIKYDSMNNICFSDHKPVYGYFHFNYK